MYDDTYEIHMLNQKFLTSQAEILFVSKVLLNQKYWANDWSWGMESKDSSKAR